MRNLALIALCIGSIGCRSSETDGIPELALLGLPPSCSSLRLPDANGSSAAASTVNMTSNVLVLHFDSPPGSLVSSSSHAATFSGGSPVTDAGKLLYGLSGNGTQFPTSVTPPVTLNTVGTTMMVWVYRRSPAAASYLPLYNGNSSLRGYGLLVDVNSDFDVITGGNTVQTTGAALPMNAWTHLAVTVSTPNTFTPYVNGSQLPSFGLTFGAVIAGDTTFLEFGAGSTDTIDEAAIWDRVLSASEIQAIYQLQSQRCD